MLAPDLVVRGRRVVLTGSARAASIAIRSGRIAWVGGPDDPVPPGCPVVDAGDLVVMPGLVDTHVHVNEPGRAEWEGFASATRAAAAGGVTTLVDMPLNSVPATTSAAGLAAKVAAARGKLWVDVGFCGGVVPGNEGEIAGLRAAGVLGFKCFLTESGVDEFRRVGPDDLRAAMRRLADLDAPLLVHAELEGPIAEARQSMPPGEDPRRYATYLASRPKRAENEAVALLVGLARETRSRVHVVHLSSAEALSILWRAREDGLRVSAETCPHYLALAAEEIEDGATEFKCAPPIREAGNRELLWGALGDGLVAQVVSDHSPCVPEMKRLSTGDFLAAWGGIASLQLGLAVVWTEARRRGHGVERLAEWMCAGPARLVGLEDRKGSIAAGRDADLVIWDPEARFTVRPERLEHRNKLTPYRGRALEGAVVSTWLRGRRIWGPDVGFGEPCGTLLRAGIRSDEGER